MRKFKLILFVSLNSQCFLQCISENLKLFGEHDDEPNYDKIMQHVDFFVLGNKRGLREKIETCVTKTERKENFCDYLHDAYQCFWKSSKGLGRQFDSIVEKIKSDLNKKT